MEIQELQRIAGSIAGTETGGWLQNQLHDLRNSQESFSVLFVNSAGLMADSLFQGKSEISFEWEEISSDNVSEFANEAILKYDAIVWVLDALQMFPGTFRPILIAACSKGVPIFGVVTGLGLLGDRRRFVREVLPQHRRELPEASELYLHDPQRDSFTIADIRASLNDRQAPLAARGYRRRKEEVLTHLRNRIDRDLRNLGQTLTSANNRMAALRSKLEALEPEAKAVPVDIQLAFKDLGKTLDSLTKDVREHFMSEEENVARKDPQDAIADLIHSCRERRFRPEMEAIVRSQVEHVDNWRVQRSEELKRFLRPFDTWLQDGVRIEELLKPDCDETTRTVAECFRELEKDLMETFNVLDSELRSDAWLQALAVLGTIKVKTLTPEESPKPGKVPGNATANIRTRRQALFDAFQKASPHIKKQRILTLLENACEEAKNSLENIVKRRVSRIGSKLANEFQSQVEPCLKAIQASIDGIEELRRQLDEARSELRKALVP